MSQSRCRTERRGRACHEGAEQTTCESENCPHPAPHVSHGTLRNRTIRTTSQAVINYFEGYEELLPEEKLLLLLDKVRLAAIFGGASVINTVDDAPDGPATCNAVGQAIASITSLCSDLWSDLGGCRGCSCSEAESEKFSEETATTEKIVESPEWGENADVESGTEEISKWTRPEHIEN